MMTNAAAATTGVTAERLKPMANAVRALAMDAVEAAKSGHPGMPMGMADAATLLFARYLKFDPADPAWADRDRFVLSAGHGSMLLYALLHLTGYPGVTMEEIKRFRQLGSKTPGHPEYGHTAGVETTTGPLGQGLANAVGMAIAEAHLRARFGAELVDHRTWVVAGDGCLMEGVSQEAISLAGRLKLNRLIVIWDDNAISIDGAVSLSDITDQRARFEASGWLTLACDGHDFDDIARAYDAALGADRPVLIACKTTIGFGAPKRAGTAKAHGEPLGAEELAAAKAALEWPFGPFEIPEDVRAFWQEAAGRAAPLREAWRARLAASKDGPALRRQLDAPDGDAVAAAQAHAQSVAAAQPKKATRALSGDTLAAMWPASPGLFGGSADLTGSNNTHVAGVAAFTPETPEGRYLHYGVREHAMAAAMNGMALHGGVAPYGGTFLCFADYSRPAIRLAALMGVRVVHVMTHDSIGLGEDGPTHQPVEHLASLRAIPNLFVFRPADGVETAECWAAALSLTASPSVLVLTRQALPPVRTDADVNLSMLGAYEIAPAVGEGAKIALFASGSEVALALAAREALQAEGHAVRVVSCPCFELFQMRRPAERAAVIGPPEEVRVGVEAGVDALWRETFALDAMVAMPGFGASAPAADLFQHFGFTADAVADVARIALAARSAGPPL